MEFDRRHSDCLYTSNRLFTTKTATAYEVHNLGNRRYKIRTSSGRIAHILRHFNGTWTVPEDDHQRVFPSYDDVLDCAHELAGDPDLLPLSQTKTFQSITITLRNGDGTDICSTSASSFSIYSQLYGTSRVG